MNYIAQFNAYFELLLINPLSSSAQALYTNLFNINNKCNWIIEFTVANLTLQTLTGLSRQALDRARNELIQKRYISYKKGSGNNAGKYSINNLCVDFVTQNDTQTITQSDTQSNTQSGHSACTLYKHKQNINKKENIKEKNQFEQIISEIENVEVKNALVDFIAMRDRIKKPLSDTSLKLVIKKLNSLSNIAEDQVDILNNSIMNNWQGIFELPEKNKNSCVSKKQFEQREYQEKDYVSLYANF